MFLLAGWKRKLWCTCCLLADSSVVAGVVFWPQWCACRCCLLADSGVVVCAGRCFCWPATVWLCVLAGVSAGRQQCGCVCLQVFLLTGSSVVVCACRCFCWPAAVWMCVLASVVCWPAAVWLCVLAGVFAGGAEAKEERDIKLPDLCRSHRHVTGRRLVCRKAPVKCC